MSGPPPSPRPLLRRLLRRVPRPSVLTGAVVAGLLSTAPARADDLTPDLSGLSFTDAFDSLCAHYSKHYAFSDWKGIDWTALHDSYAPEVLQADAAADAAAFKLAMKRFASSFPDGHVRLRGDLSGLFEGEIGGGFGLTLIQLSDARIAVNRVVAGGPASGAGIAVGAIITEWNGLPAQSALDGAEIVWEGNPPATREGARLAKLRRMVRAPVGSVLGLTFTNPGQGPVTTTLTAEDDSLGTWELSRYTAFDIDGRAVITQEQILRPVTYQILPGGVGYLRCSILVELDASGNVTGSMDDLVASLHEAVAAFDAAPVSGVIVDIRDNPGGFDALAALFGGLFYDHTELYEQASFYDDATGQFEVVPQLTLYLEPQGSYFGGPVVCLVNAGTASSAEGVAMAIQRLPQGHVMGFYGTHGSFGLVAGESALPAGLDIQFTLGRSLDSNSVIQVDSDLTLTGGVVPDLRIPLTVETVQRKFAAGVDVELEEAQAFLAAQTPAR
jgi:carboxyl-terminal processing protease